MNFLSKAQLDTLCVVHYGSKVFHAAHMAEITNRGLWNKPRGGLWTSPLNSSHSWRDWCVREEFREYAHDNCFKLKFKLNAKVLVIDKVEDLEELPILHYKDILDYPKLSKICDAIWLTVEGEQATRYSSPLSLYGWDVESIFIMKPDNVYGV